MPRERSPNRDKAFEIYKENNGDITLRDIANMLNEKEKTISNWKCRDKWDTKINCSTMKKKCSTTKEKRNKGGQPNNKNAVGHGAPAKNKNAETHGFFSKYLPEETLELIQEIKTKTPLDMLWDQIIIQYVAIIRAQKIMHVESKEEMIKELKKPKVKNNNKKTEKTSSNSTEKEYEYEFQFAWDRHATFLNAQSRAMGELRSLIRQYDEMLNANWDLATEERKLRIDKLKANLSKNDNKDKPIEILIKRKGVD